MDVEDQVRLGQVQDVGVAGHVMRMLTEDLALIIARRQPGSLQHGAPGAIQDQYALVKQAPDGFCCCHDYCLFSH